MSRISTICEDEKTFPKMTKRQAGAELGQAQPELGLEVVIWSWGLKLKLEFAECNCRLKFQVTVWGISEVYCEAEMFKLKFDIEAWNWSLRLR